MASHKPAFLLLGPFIRPRLLRLVLPLIQLMLDLFETVKFFPDTQRLEACFLDDVEVVGLALGKLGAFAPVLRSEAAATFVER